MSYGDYPGSSPGQANNEQLAYLLFFKMACERIKGDVTFIDDFIDKVEGVAEPYN